jgi:hypothetical protein
VALRLGPLTIPWPGSDSRDDPYWEHFLSAPVGDARNSVPALIRGAPEGAVNPARETLHTPEITSSHIKELARFLGADLVGIARLESAAPEDGESYPFAIVCAVRAEHDPRDTPGFAGLVPDENGLYVSFVLSAYIRELGYRATARGGTDAERLAIQAGLGTLNAAGRLVTPQYGTRVHLADLIRTDLPLVADG